MFLRYYIKFFISVFVSIIFSNLLLAASNEKSYEKKNFSFDGILGKIDKPSARRGLQVYTEICSGCHGLQHLAYRNLVDLGLSMDQVKSFAAQFELAALPDEEGEINMRPALPYDKFVNPYKNINQAKAMNNGAVPPDLSLIIKAREGGASYFYGLLAGYDDAPDGFDVGNGYYNKVYPGHIIAMPQPLYGNDVEYIDGTEASLNQEIYDLTMFLTWASQPELNIRKQIGFKTILFLIFMTSILFLSYKKIWKKVKSGIV
tara:strand:- start:25933 stop:26712 length:780 start_codon:yes stop_codon:yes gene_type:complete